MFLNTFVSTTLFLKCPLFYLSKYLRSPRVCSRFTSFVRLSLKHHTKLCFLPLSTQISALFTWCSIFLATWRMTNSFTFTQVLPGFKTESSRPWETRSPRHIEVVGHPAGHLLIGGWVSAVKGLFPSHPCVPGPYHADELMNL